MKALFFLAVLSLASLQALAYDLNSETRISVTCKTKFAISDETVNLNIPMSGTNELSGFKSHQANPVFRTDAYTKLSLQNKELVIDLFGYFRNSKNDFWKQTGEHVFTLKLDESGREAGVVKTEGVPGEFNIIKSCKVYYYN